MQAPKLRTSRTGRRGTWVRHYKRFEASAELESAMEIVAGMTTEGRLDSRDRGVEWHPMEYHIDHTDPGCDGFTWMTADGVLAESLRVALVGYVRNTINYGRVITRKALSDESLTGDGVHWVFKSVVEV